MNRQGQSHQGPRRHRWRLPLALLLIPFLIGLFPAPVATGDELSDALANKRAIEAKIANQKHQVAKLAQLQDQLRGDIATTRQALNGYNADLATVKTQIKKMAADIAQVRATYLDLVDQLTLLDEQLGRITIEQAVKQAQLDERKAMLASRVQAAYETDRTSMLETILSANSFADVVADVGYYLDIGEQDKALAKQIVHDQVVLAALKDTVTETRQQTDDLRVQTAAERKDLASRMGDLKAAQAQLKQLEAETAHQLAIQRAAYLKMARNQAALRRAIAAEAHAEAVLKKKIAGIIARQYALGNIPSVYNGTLEWPLVGVVTQEFGCTGVLLEPWNGYCHFHNGIDIADPMYTPIRAAGPGRVVYAGPLSDGAWVVIIAHSQQLQTWYAHLDDARHPPAVRTGEVVQQGEVIGYVGMTGHTTGPHLHWMVELNGTFSNPRLFV